ncbi:MAG TPA: sugar ABC transporter ATP-binding protein [Bryobacteraceae bacterium]|nr:sugar ABC transporter ATP-binding protein [Bryobacteraceae bacterium]
MVDHVLEAISVSKAFSGVKALRDVSFELRPGEVHALIGENGAGKSTLIKIITGAVQPDAGVIKVRGEAVHHMDPRVSKALGIAAIYQQPALFPDLTVTENIALALETGHPWRRLDWNARRRRAAQLLERAGASINPERLVATLSMPEQQLVEIAKAIGAEARIVIMDEPTASLTEREVESLFAVVTRLRTEGAGVIYISHRLEEIATVADRVTVLRDGQSIATKNLGEVDRAELIRLMVGRELSSIFPKREITLGEAILELRDVSSRAAGIHNVFLDLKKGEILGIAGLVGSGRTQLAETIFGLTPADTGEILLGGTSVKISSPADAIRLGIGYVPEDRPRHGAILDMSITANTSLANLRRVSRHGLIDNAEDRELAEGFVRQLRTKAPSVDVETGSLSGGNQQKVALARWLAIEPSVLILDEPTQGVDVGSKSEIHALMAELAAKGLAIIMISSELPELLGMSDRVAVMHHGAIRGILDRKDATQQAILSLALGHAA